ncbi:MAG: porin [Hydrogenophaga sp.]|jgi:predicted porin|uniref:porin n=1 Tax=Hydrogenophaga sp. TaxID=1904254 RepID=UPI00262251CB|nr:porin [Hydrogenophaga sp.]MCV0440281.1 porin [Hydrogenophaga sp.]
MKKSLIALAALATLAAAGTASAQSSVTVYGIVDLSVGSQEVNGVSTTQMSSGDLSTSRLGFRGTEDLGGGLRANFQLEAPLTVDDGNIGGLRFTRASWVGLSGGFGAVRMGLMNSAYKDVFDLGQSQNLYDSVFSPYNVAYGGIGQYTGRPGNTLRYDTPSFGGVSASANYTFSEDTGAQIGALNVRYTGGPLAVGVAIQNQRPDNVANNTDHTILSASYDFGVARISGSYQLVDTDAGNEDKELSLGVTVPFGAFTVSAGYARGDSENAAGATVYEGSAFALGGTYALSKRTTVYVAYLDGERETAGVKTDNGRYAMGLRHSF